MKLTDGMKRILIKKLSDSFEKRVTLAEFNEVFLFLDRWNTAFKTVPYGIFESEEKEYIEPLSLEDTQEGVVFNKWLEYKTSNIEKDFNKSRKLIRILKNIITTQHDSLAYNLSANNIFTIVLTAFYIDYDEERVPFKFSVKDVGRFNEVIKELRGYLATLFFIDMVSDNVVIEKIIDLFINGEEEEHIKELIKYGIIYR